MIPEGPSEGDRVAAPRKSNFSAVPATATPIASRRNRPQQARHHERTGGGNRNKISVENEWSFKNIPLIATAVAGAMFVFPQQALRRMPWPHSTPLPTRRCEREAP